MVKIAGEQFADNTACITCVHVLGDAHIKLVSRDDDKEWQFLCGQTVHEAVEGRVISLAEAVILDSRLATVAPLNVGEVRSI